MTGPEISVLYSDFPRVAPVARRADATCMVAPKLERLKAADVCQIAQVQPYVLRSWEAEFPDLGQPTNGGPRIYGRADVERVLRIRELVYVEGLTLAGARRKLLEEQTTAAETAGLDELLGSDARERILRVKQGLREIATILAKDPGQNGDAPSLFDLARPAKSARKKR